MIAGLDPEYSRLVLAATGGRLVGWLHVGRHRDPLVRHWGTVRRVQSHPEARGLGVGTALMDGVRQIARDEMGMEQLHLGARGGEGLEEFYGRLGWREIGRHPGALRFAHGDRDEVFMLLRPL
ncbi:GNAT family N-acetyltransferase [Yinghuangia soli]